MTNTLNLGVSKLNNCAGELARFSFPLVWLWSGGATSGWWAYLLSETCDGAGTVRTRRHWQALLSGSPTRAPGPAGVAWSVAWRAQVKPGGEECDSANKVAPRRRKRPGFSLPSSLYLAFLPSTFQKKALRDIRPTSPRRSTCTGPSMEKERRETGEGRGRLKTCCPKLKLESRMNTWQCAVHPVFACPCTYLSAALK